MDDCTTCSYEEEISIMCVDIFFIRETTNCQQDFTQLPRRMSFLHKTFDEGPPVDIKFSR